MILNNLKCANHKNEKTWPLHSHCGAGCNDPIILWALTSSIIYRQAVCAKVLRRILKLQSQSIQTKAFVNSWSPMWNWMLLPSYTCTVSFSLSPTFVKYVVSERFFFLIVFSVGTTQKIRPVTVTWQDWGNSSNCVAVVRFSSLSHSYNELEQSFITVVVIIIWWLPRQFVQAALRLMWVYFQGCQLHHLGTQGEALPRRWGLL